MRRADRLFQIIQVLRGSPGPVRAVDLARELEVAPRTVYRDVADLIARRVPIRGEAGLGYVLDRSYSMPPLMLTPDELEAAVLGAQWIAGHADPSLAGAARDLLAKITAAVPDRLRGFVTDPSVGAAPARTPTAGPLDLARTRAWIRAGRKMRLSYRDIGGRETSRVVWPVMVGYAEGVRLLAAWCELRNGFRHFRSDRVVAAEFLDEHHARRPGELRRAWKRHFEAERGIRLP